MESQVDVSFISIQSGLSLLTWCPSQDTLKGSYYANPIMDEPEEVAHYLRRDYPEYYGRNICKMSLLMLSYLCTYYFQGLRLMRRVSRVLRKPSKISEGMLGELSAVRRCLELMYT
jgi:hypothetical protein